MPIPSKLHNSVLILDKPYGYGSHDITSYVRKLFEIPRAGHAGTLDPAVSGVLPIALGKATKLLRFIASKRKTYVGIIKFKNILSKGEVEKLFAQFTGTITQTPPKESAVRKVARRRTIYRLQLLELDGRLGLFEADVDAGTYIRTLCVDIGHRCGGARMEELRRVAVGQIPESKAVSLLHVIDAVWLWKNKGDPKQLEAMLHAPDTWIDFPSVEIKPTAVASVLHGAQVMAPAVASFPPSLAAGQLAKLYSEGRFLGIGKTEVSGADFPCQTHGLAIRIERIHASLFDR